VAALLDVYKPELWAQETLMQLFPTLKFAGLVHRDFDAQVQSVGDVVNTRMPHTMVATNVDPDSFVSVKPTADNVEVRLDQWKQVVYEIGDKEASMTIRDLQSDFAKPAAEALGGAYEDAIVGLYSDVGNITGIAGTTPATISALGTDIQEKFNTLNVAETDRSVVLGPKAHNKYNQVFYQDYVSGSPAQQTEGQLTRKFGMSYTNSNRLARHVTGIAGTVTCSSNQAASVLNAGSIVAGTLAVTGMTANAKKGDIITLDHGAVLGVCSYNVTADTAHSASAATLPIFPALRAAVVSTQSVTIIASHDVNIAFAKNAFALVTRPLKVPNAPGASVYTASIGNITIRASVWYEAKDLRTYVRIDSLFGVKTLDPRKAIRVLG